MTTQQAIQKMRDVIRLRHLSHATEQTYCGWLVRFVRFVSDALSNDQASEPMDKELNR